MKRFIKRIGLMLLALLIGYGVTEMVIPQKAFAVDQPLTGKVIQYNGKPACDCRTSDNDCLCLPSGW